MSLGIYISVPFCRSKCSFCNFASGVFSPERMAGYTDKVVADLRNAVSIAHNMGGRCEREIDSIYLGGGTPSLLQPSQMRALFDAIKAEFTVTRSTGSLPEITVECAPNSLADDSLAAMLDCGVNRISFGAQSLVDRETNSVARMHSAKHTVHDVQRVRQAGIENISIDLIAGLPRQTLASWDYSLQQVIDLGVPHVSIYMLEVDEGSRLGSELLAGGVKYHAHTVPEEELIVQMYKYASERLEQAGIDQYEISNFARSGWESKHNLKYWLRQPYFGFGADAHSMLHADANSRGVILSDPELREGESKDPCFQIRDVRFAALEELNDFERATGHYVAPSQMLTNRDALEEAMIVGLRLNRGVQLHALAQQYGEDPNEVFAEQIEELVSAELLSSQRETLKLTPRGRLLSNEVFERFLHSKESLTGERV